MDCWEDQMGERKERIKGNMIEIPVLDLKLIKLTH
jgi:hypothetical protein